MLPPLSLLYPPREFGTPMRQWATTVRVPRVCENTLYRKCCTVVCYLDNCSAVGVMAHKVLWHLWCFHNETCIGGYLSHGREGIGGKGTLALTPWSTWTTTWRRKGLLPAVVSRRSPVARCRGTTTAAGGGAAALPAAEAVMQRATGLLP